MNYTPTQRLWWLSYWIFLLISFCLVGFWLVSRAIGYRYNPQQHRLQKTGMIILTDPPKESVLTIDSKHYPLKPQTRIPNVLPGTYRLVITKPDYQPWEEVVTISSGFVVNINHINLFYSRPVEVTDSEHYQNLTPYYTVHDDRIRIVDGELWFGSQLVSRFSQPPSKAILWPSNNQIVYLQGNEVRVIDINGEHDLLLYRREIDDPELLVVIDNNLVFRDKIGLKVLRIQ